MSFRCKSLASRADDQVSEIVEKIEERIEETEKREAIWVKNRCKFRANDERRDELADDEMKNFRVSWTDEADEENDRAEKMIDFRADNKMNSQETVEANEVELDHSDQTSFMICWRVIFRSHIRCISFKSSSSLSSFECLVSS